MSEHARSTRPCFEILMRDPNSRPPETDPIIGTSWSHERRCGGGKNSPVTPGGKFFLDDIQRLARKLQSEARSLQLTRSSNGYSPPRPIQSTAEETHYIWCARRSDTRQYHLRSGATETCSTHC